MKLESANLPDGLLKEKLSQMKFGQYERDLPIVFNYAEQVLDKRLTYNEVLEKNPGFANPSNVEVLSEDLGLSNIVGQSSLFPSLRYQCGPFFSLSK